jgi:tRNA uridine 5-carboxymethylaminomethyl modification enzyme
MQRAGRRSAGDHAVARLKELKLPQGRLKDGTPPRIDGRTIDFSVLTEQPGDLDPVPVFSFLGDAAQHPRQVPCWITHTNARTHEIIRSASTAARCSRRDRGNRSALLPKHRGQGQPLRDKDSHQIFLEPRG